MPKRRFVRSSTTFEGTGGEALSKTLAGKYGVVLWKIVLECSGFSVNLQSIIFLKLWSGSGFTARIVAILV